MKKIFEVDGDQILFEESTLISKDGKRNIPVVRYTRLSDSQEPFDSSMYPFEECFVFTGFALPDTEDEAMQMCNKYGSDSTANDDWREYVYANNPECVTFFDGRIVCTKINFIYGGETELQDGYIVHDNDDEFYDSDVILNVGDLMAYEDEDMLNIFDNDSSRYIRYIGHDIWHIYA